MAQNKKHTNYAKFLSSSLLDISEMMAERAAKEWGERKNGCAWAKNHFTITAEVLVLSLAVSLSIRGLVLI